MDQKTANPSSDTLKTENSTPIIIPNSNEPRIFDDEFSLENQQEELFTQFYNGNTNYIYEFKPADMKYRDIMMQKGLRDIFQGAGSLLFFNTGSYFLHKNGLLKKTGALQMSAGASLLTVSLCVYSLVLKKTETQEYLFNRFLKN